MDNRIRVAFAAVGFLTAFLSASFAFAKNTAHFRVESLDGGCINGDSEPFGAGDPERHFRIGIFDSSTVSQTCANGCTGDDGNPSTVDVRTLDYCSTNTGCGYWNFLNQTVSKVVPPGGGVYFYFGLFDEDNDASDSLGDHWFFTGRPRFNESEINNNGSPYYVGNSISSVCSWGVEGLGTSGNYTLTYSMWFTDDTGPDMSGATPQNSDDGQANVNDNDTRLDWNWGAAVDADSGISDYRFTLENVTTGTNVFTAQPASLTRSISFCANGCNYTYTPVHGHRYRLRVQATNGNYPELSNATSTWSNWSPTVTVDLRDPSAQVVAPSAGSWHNAGFSVDFADSDSGTGVDASSCQWRVTSDGTVTRNWANRTCDASRALTVGPGADCDSEGADVCLVDALNSDGARRSSSIGSRPFGIDWTADTMGSVDAFTTSGGAPIDASGWTMDRDPYFAWPASASVSPILGYSWALDASPDCGSTEVPGAGPLEVQLVANRLNDGVHEFQIRAVDQAGNCGPVVTRTVQVDATADAVAGLRATNSGGAQIAEATWQTENAPTMAWDPSTSTAPITGYSVGTGAASDCTVDTTMTSVALPAQTDGVVRFWVRAVDEAGNCGPESVFALHIDTVADPVTNLRAFTQPGGSPIMNGVAQSDRDPWMEWDAAVSSAPIVGYATGTGPLTDCVVDTVATDAQLAMLPDGASTFWVRAVDEAGNCGPAATFDIVIGVCGDGDVGVDEECDDGNMDSTDACVACMNAICGDGAVWEGNEKCDEGDENDDLAVDGCRTDCRRAYCGDGVVDTGEGCDDGDANADDGLATCRTTCVLATCGDGILDVGETCDDGAANSDTEPGACRTMCIPAFCGDSVSDPGEACDDGELNSDVEPDACRTSCNAPACGDGVADEGESCDDGELNSDTEPDACRTNCVPAFCGDDVVDSEEACESPDVRGDQVCLDDCQFGPRDVPTTMPDAGGADAGTDIDGSRAEPNLVDSGVGGCCRVAAGSKTEGWEALFAIAVLISVSRRRRRR